MLVSKVNSTIPNTSFRGIFLERGMEYIDNTHYDHGMEQDMGTTHTITYKEYYPYMNEKKIDIDKAVKKERSLKKHEENFLEHIFETKVIVKDKLPITEAEGKAFMERFKLPEQDFVKFTELIKLVTRKMPKHK